MDTNQGSQFRTVLYRSVPLEYTVPASKPVHITPLFHTGKNTGRTDQFRAIPVGTEKKFLFIYLFILSFVIFEFLLGQNGNLLVLFVFLVCYGTIEIVILAQFTLGLKARAEVGYSRGHIIKVQVTLKHSRG